MSLVDTRIDVDDFLPRVPLGRHRRSASLPLSLDEGSSSCLSLSYYSKLPEEPLKLTVLKLDGSSFDVEVMRSATVMELKEAVEAVFSHVPRKGPGKISWSHVWTHFCLSFDGQKLVEDTDYIRDYGIRDGDELQFVRHLSTKFHSPSKKRSSKQKNSLVRQSSILSLPRRIEQERIDDEAEFYDNMENGKHQNLDDMDYKVSRNEDMCVRLFRRWLPYSKLSTSEETSSLKGGPPSPSRSACGLFYSCKRALDICCSNHYSLKDYREE